MCIFTACCSLFVYSVYANVFMQIQFINTFFSDWSRKGSTNWLWGFTWFLRYKFSTHLGRSNINILCMEFIICNTVSDWGGRICIQCEVTIICSPSHLSSLPYCLFPQFVTVWYSLNHWGNMWTWKKKFSFLNVLFVSCRMLEIWKKITWLAKERMLHCLASVWQTANLLLFTT